MADLQNYESALLFSDQSMRKTIQQNDTALFIQNLNLQADIYSKQKKWQAALKSYLKIIDLLQKQKKSDALNDYYFQIALIYFGIENYKKAQEYFQLYSISDTAPPAQQYRYYRFNGDNFLALNHDSLAIAEYEQAYRLALKNNDKPKQIEFMYLMSEAYEKMNIHSKVLALYIDIYQLQSNDEQIAASINNLNNVGYAYLKVGDYKNALAMFKQAVIADQKNNTDPLAQMTALINQGLCYQNLNENKNAVNVLNQALTLAQKYKNTNKQAVVENLMALIYFQDDDLYNAQSFSLQSLKHAQEPQTKQNCYNTYSKILQGLNDYEEALEYYKKYLSIRDSLLVEQRLNEQQQKELQEELQKFEDDYKLQLADEAVKNLALKQLELEAEKRQQELELLQRARKMQELENERVKQSLLLAQKQNEAMLDAQKIKELEQQKKMQDLEIERKQMLEDEQKREIELLENEKQLQRLEIDKQAEEQKRMRWVAGLFSIIFILIVIGLIIAARVNKKLAARKREIELKNVDLEQKNEEIMAQKESLQEANNQISNQNLALVQKQEEISAQNEIIEKKNKNITDSIFYAKRIQTAIMPPPTIMANHLAEYFVLFRPRDIVSGDFYWFFEQKDKLIVVAADSTGHGVPGAFMSMLGISSLNEIMSHPVQNAAQILNRLREKVKSALRQTGKDGEAKDGMDVALCLIDKQTEKIHFAGANNPLYHINTDGQLLVYKPDKMPIGIHKRENPSFTNHVIERVPNHQFYLFSDGYIDQFGGKYGRKFLSRNFKNLLLNHHHESQNQQLQVLEQTLDQWQGNTFEQLDDILVIGIKI